MGKVLGANCNAAGFSISGTIWEKFLCKECRSPCGFEVKLKYVRCVPAEIQPPEKVVEGGNKGGSENGWRKGAAPGSPLVCLCNEPKVVKETKREDGKSVPTGRETRVYYDPRGALVMLHPDSVGIAPADWTEPSQRTHPEWDIKDGMVRRFYGLYSDGKGHKQKMVTALRPPAGQPLSSGAASSSGVGAVAAGGSDSAGAPLALLGVSNASAAALTKVGSVIPSTAQSVAATTPSSSSSGLNDDGSDAMLGSFVEWPWLIRAARALRGAADSKRRAL